MRLSGVSEWDTPRPGTTERYTSYDPNYLNEACAALGKDGAARQD